MAVVIVVSPNDQVREVLLALVRETGAEVRGVSNSVDALAACRVETPDLVLVEAFGRNAEVRLLLDALPAVRVALVYGSATDASVLHHERVSYSQHAPCSSATMRTFLRQCSSRRGRLAASSGVRRRMELPEADTGAPLRTANKPRS